MERANKRLDISAKCNSIQDGRPGMDIRREHHAGGLGDKDGGMARSREHDET